MPLSPEQLEQRRGLITASDLAAVCGLNPWRKPIDVYLDKIGEGPPFPESWRMERGNIMEDALIRYLGSQLSPLNVRPAGEETFVHPILTWFGATSDGLAFDKGELVATCEAKFAMSAPHHWENEQGDLCVPDYYAVQVQGQMSARTVKRGYVVADLGREEPILFELEHDPEFEAAILETADRFMNYHVAKRVPPAIDTSSMREVKARYQKNKEAFFLTSTPTAEALALGIADAKARKKAAEAELETLEAQMCALIGEAEGIGGRDWSASWRYVEPAEIKPYVRKGYRKFDFRLRTKKEESL